MDELIVIFVTTSLVELNLIRNKLELENIQCFVKDELSTQTISSVVGGAKLLVYRTQVDQALEILKELGIEPKNEISPIEQEVGNLLLTYVFDNQGNVKPILKNILFLLIIAMIIYMIMG